MGAKKTAVKKVSAKAKPLRAHARKKKAASRKSRQHVAPRATSTELLASLPSKATALVDDLIARIWG